jgi:hypothetical protein
VDHEHDRREHAEEYWRRTPEREREDVRRVARELLGKHAAESGVPVEELVTPELVEEFAVHLLEHIQAQLVEPVVGEHVTEEDMERWMGEEYERLHSQSEGEGVREDVLNEAVMLRVLAERAELRSWLDRRRDS